jgi:glutamate-5-semialdehyde dehydrogenase
MELNTTVQTNYEEFPNKRYLVWEQSGMLTRSWDMENSIAELESKARLAREASRLLAFLPTETKNNALNNIVAGLRQHEGAILTANAEDFREAQAFGMTPAMLDRLKLTPKRLQGIADDVLAVVALPDPIGEVFEMRTLPNGLLLGKKRVPIGVIATIYESRPNVTVDIASLCLKTGNAVILRGGKETIQSNMALAAVVREASLSKIPTAPWWTTCSQCGKPLTW